MNSRVRRKKTQGLILPGRSRGAFYRQHIEKQNPSNMNSMIDTDSDNDDGYDNPRDNYSVGGSTVSSSDVSAYDKTRDNYSVGNSSVSSWTTVSSSDVSAYDKPREYEGLGFVHDDDVDNTI